MAPAFLEVFRGILERGNMLPYLCSGEIILIPKLGDHSHIGNWHPTTLFDKIYKIVAKVMVCHFQPHFHMIVRPSQINFVKGWNIIDNVYLAQIAFAWLEESQQHLVFFFLNFEKAFDHITRATSSKPLGDLDSTFFGWNGW